MQRKPIANKYRKGTMKSTLQARTRLTLCVLCHALVILCVHAPTGVKKRVKSPNGTCSLSVSVAFVTIVTKHQYLAFDVSLPPPKLFEL